MVAVERVGRYIEQIDAIDKRKRNEATIKALQRQVKSKAVSRMLQWTLSSQRHLHDIGHSTGHDEKKLDENPLDWDYERDEDDTDCRGIVDDTELEYSQVRADPFDFKGLVRDSPPSFHATSIQGGTDDDNIKAEIVAQVTNALQQATEPTQAGTVQKVNIAIQVHHIPVSPDVSGTIIDDRSQLRPWWSRCCTWGE